MMKNLLFIFILIVLGCKAHYQTPSATVEKVDPVDDAKPSWVMNKPISSQYYHGVGNASLRDPNYQQTAKLEALEDLASEISIQIESSSLLNQIETNYSFKESYRSSVISKTQQEIEEYELVETWSDQHQYWTYYRLNKRSYSDRREAQKKQAMDLAVDHFSKAKSQHEEEFFVQSMQSYAQVLEDLKPYLNESNQTTIDGEQYLLANESIHRIRNILSQTRLTTDRVDISVTDDTEPITVEVTYESIPVKGLPINLSNETDEKISNASGQVSTRISRKDHSNLFFAETSLSFLSNYDIAYQLLNNLPLPRLEVQLKSKPLTFSIHSDETNLGEELRDKLLAPFFEKVLTELGTLINQTEPDYIIAVKGTTRQGSETSGLFSAFLSIHVSIKNTKGETLYQDTFDEIKGLNTSFPRAGVTAYRNVPIELEKAIKKSLNENFFKKK